MARIFQLPPDPGIQAALNYVSNLQAERFRREQERAQERTFDLAGALGGGLFGAFPTRGEVKDEGFGSRFAAGGIKALPVVATAVGGAIGGPPGAALGAQLGSSITQQVSGGTAAGSGIGPATKAVAGIMQFMDDQQHFGSPLTKQERTAFAQQAAKLGLTMKQAKSQAAQAGQTVPQLLQGLQFDRADIKTVQDILNRNDIPMSADEFISAAGDDRTGFFEELRGQVADFKADSAAKKQFAQTTARLQAELEAGARNEQMEMRFDPRELTQRSADLKDIDQGFANGDFTLEQANQQKAALPRLQPTFRPRQTPRTIEEEEVVSQKTGQIYVRDARNPTGFRHVGSMKDLSGPPRTFEEAMAQLSPQQRMEMANKTRTQLFIEAGPEDNDPASPAQVAARMRANFDATNFTGQPQPAPQGQGAPQPQQPQNPAAVAMQRVQQGLVVLTNLMSEKPLDSWTEQELDQGGNIVTTVLADLQAFPRGDPQALAMARKVLELKELIDAQRNR